MFLRIEDLKGKKGDVKQQVLFMLDAAQVLRWHNRPTLKPNTDAHHSWGVAMFVWLLTSGKASANLIMRALTHDCSEQVWGDIPAPTKWDLGLKETLQALEDETLADNGFMFKIPEEAKVILQMADYLDAMLYCVAERRLGNLNLDGAYSSMAIRLNPTNDRQLEVCAAVESLWREVCPKEHKTQTAGK